MTPHAVSSNGHSQYILTQTLFEHLNSFKRVGLKIPHRTLIDEIEEGLAALIRKSFDGSKFALETINFGEFCDEIISSARDIKTRMPDAVIVSTTPMISYETSGICVGLSRLIDMDGNIISVGSRAGSDSVERQIESIAERISGRRVIILEDGSFTGGTLCYMLDKLSGTGAKVEAIVMGILFPDAKERLAKSFKGELVHKYQFEKPYDWMPSHDFFPFIPNSGRVIGTQVGDSLIPAHMFDHSTLSKPYILPYGELGEWAGLTHMQRKQLLELSIFCLSGAIRIFEEMEKLNDRPINKFG